MSLIRRTPNLHEQYWLHSNSGLKMLMLLKKQPCARLTRASMQRKKPVSIQHFSVHMIRHIYACAPVTLGCPGSDC